MHKLVADVAPIARGKVVLVRYRDTRKYDGQAGWFLPDDYLEHGEHPEEAAKRILREQVGLPARGLRLSHIESFGNGAWHLVFHYAADVAGTSPLIAGPNVADSEWFPFDALPSKDEVAHGGWAHDVLARIRAERG